MGGINLLHDTIVLQVSDMGDGRSHSGENVPYMLTGSGGGVLNTGRSLALDGVSIRVIALESGWRRTNQEVCPVLERE